MVDEPEVQVVVVQARIGDRVEVYPPEPGAGPTLAGSIVAMGPNGITVQPDGETDLVTVRPTRIRRSARSA